MVFVWSPGSSSSVPVGRGGIVGLSEKSGYLDYQKKKNDWVKNENSGQDNSTVSNKRE